MNSSGCQSPNQETIYGAKSQFSVSCPGSKSGVILQHPANLGSGEVRVKDQAGFFPKPWLIRLPLPAEVGGAPILPDKGPAHRTASIPIPQNACFTLVGDADSC